MRGSERKKPMSVIQFDADELQPLVDMAVETAVRRLRDERSSQESGKLLLDKRAAADALSVSVSTLDRLTHPRGDLRAVKLQGRTLYSPDELRRWITEREGQDVADGEENVETTTCTDRSNG